MKKLVIAGTLTMFIFAIVSLGGYVIVREYITTREQNEVYDVTMPVQNASKPQVAQIMVTNWLHRFTTRRFVSKIYEYKIHSIDIGEEGGNYFVFTAEFSVKADKETTWKDVPHIVDGDWIRVKGQFRINQAGNVYHLVGLGYKVPT
ncbi:MAG TPA: hypothetical protein VGD58_08195 [Herpetosiphonaceae bacterium]